MYTIPFHFHYFATTSILYIETPRRNCISFVYGEILQRYMPVQTPSLMAIHVFEYFLIYGHYSSAALANGISNFSCMKNFDTYRFGNQDCCFFVRKIHDTKFAYSTQKIFYHNEYLPIHCRRRSYNAMKRQFSRRPICLNSFRNSTSFLFLFQIQFFHFSKYNFICFMIIRISQYIK